VPTLDDLRATLHDRAESCDGDAFTALVMTDRPNRAPRRRLAAPLLAAAAVVAAVGAAATAGTALHRDTGGQAAGLGAAPRPVPTWQFTIADVPGWTVSYDFALWADGQDGIPGAWGEGATLTPTKGRATITYGYEPGVAGGYPGNGMGGSIADGSAVSVTINGQPGWWAPGRTVDTSSITPAAAADPWAAVKDSGDWLPQLVWKNPDGKSWNMLMGTVGFRPKTYSFDNVVARKAMIRIAKAVSLTAPGGPLTLPFAAHVGDRYRFDQLESRSGAACGEWTINPSTDLVRICRVTADQQRSARLGLSGGDDNDEDVARRDLGDGTVLVAVLYHDARHHLDATDLLDSADVTPKLGDRSTWLPIGS
jgi:hypothetical protein